MCCLIKYFCLLAILTVFAAISSAEEFTVTSFEPSQSNLVISSPDIQTIERKSGGTDNAPFATQGRYVLKLQWTGQSDHKVEISLSGLNYNLAGFNKILVDVYIPENAALFQSNGIIGIWSSNWIPGNWTGGNIVPTEHNKWFTIEMNVIAFNPGILNYISAIVFENYSDSAGTIYIDNLRLINNIPSVSATGCDSRIDLRWEPIRNAEGYNIYRSDSQSGPFTKLNSCITQDNVYSDFLGTNGLTKYYYVTARVNGFEFSGSKIVSASTSAMNDEQLLNSVQDATFRYFWDYGHPANGLSRDYDSKENKDRCAIGGTGMGLMAICVGAERGFVSRADAADRVLKIVQFLRYKAVRFHGAWPHFVNGITGEAWPASQYDDGADLVETSYVAQGLLTIRQYFNSDDPVERAIRDIANELWEGIDWYWFLRRSDAGYENNEILYWHWSPDYGWAMNLPITNFYNEVMITYLLALASPTHPIPSSCYYNGWACGGYKNGNKYYGYTQWVSIFETCMFWTHYSFLGFDPRNKWDNYCNYFENSRNIALIDRAYCTENPKDFKDYNDTVWGLTAGYDPCGYGAQAPGNPDNGTINPTAAISSIVYTPQESIAFLKYLYHHYGSDVWGNYGFVDGFNPTEAWFSDSFIAIDQGPIIVMIENYRTNLCWNLFMSNHEIWTMLENIGWATRADNGLNYEYYEGTWETLPDFDSLTPIAKGVANNFDIGVRVRDANFAIHFKGYLDVPSNGGYTFYLKSDDGSKLNIIGNYGTLTIDNDGLHSLVEKSGYIYLLAGRHPITVTYFQGTGDRQLLVSYSKLGLAKQQFPVSQLFRCEGNLPGDFSKDCSVDINDLEMVALNWLNGYTFVDFSTMAKNWME